MTSIAAKKKLNREDYMFRDKTGEHNLIKLPGQVNGLDFQIRNLTDCTVYLLDTTAQIMVDNCKNTNFIIGPVKGSIFVRDCTDCKVSVACSQFRCRDLNNSTVFLYVLNDPIIESSSNLKFAPYNVAYPLLDEHARAVGFDPQNNKWDLIFDFTTKDSGKNYEFLDPSEFSQITKELEGDYPSPVAPFPTPQRYGGTIADDANKNAVSQHDDGLMAFSIHTSAKDAARVVEAQEAAQELAGAAAQEEEPRIEDEDNGYHQHQQLQEEEDDNAFDMFVGSSNNTGYQAPPTQNTWQAPPQTNENAYDDFMGFGQPAAPVQNASPQQNQFSVPMYSQSPQQQQVNGGFQPAFSTTDFYQGGAPNISAQYPNIQFDDDMDEEEKERVIKAEQDRELRQRKVFEKEQDETLLKQKRKGTGRETLIAWQSDRRKQIEQRRVLNKTMEEEGLKEKKRLKETTNPWERVASNVELNSSQYVGQADVGRMRQAMIARKADITKAAASGKKPNLI